MRLITHFIQPAFIIPLAIILLLSFAPFNSAVHTALQLFIGIPLLSIFLGCAVYGAVFFLYTILMIIGSPFIAISSDGWI